MKYKLNEMVAVKQKDATGQWAQRLYHGYIRKIEETDKGVEYWIHFGPNDQWSVFSEDQIEFRSLAERYIEADMPSKRAI